PFYIETIAGRGYRFICPVAIGPEDAAEAPGIDVSGLNATAERSLELKEPREADTDRWPRRLAVAIGLLAAVIIAAVVIGSHRAPMPHVVHIAQLTHDGKSKGYQFFVDGSRLLFGIGGSKQLELRLDTGAVVRNEALDGYQMLDVSPIRGE